MITMTSIAAHRRIFYRIRRRSPIATREVRLFPDRAKEVIRQSDNRPAVVTVMTKAEVRLGRHDRVLLGKIIDIVHGENRQLTDDEWRRAIALRARLSITREVRNA